MHRCTSEVPSKDSNSRFQTNKTLAVRSHFKIGSHFSGNPVKGVFMVIPYSKGKGQPGKVANSARDQLNRENASQLSSMIRDHGS